MISNDLKNLIGNCLFKTKNDPTGTMADLIIGESRIIHFENEINLPELDIKDCIAKLPFPICLISYNKNNCFLCVETITHNHPMIDSDNGERGIAVTLFVRDGSKSDRDNILRVPASAFFVIDKDGSVKHSENRALSIEWEKSEFDTEENNISLGVDVGRLITYLTFLNCKNISLDKVWQTTDAINKRRRSEGKKELFSYYVAKIGGKNGQTLAKYGDSQSHNRLHLCRGHFKQRKSGRYWWSSHARGHKELGTIVKDYKITK